MKRFQKWQLCISRQVLLTFAVKLFRLPLHFHLVLKGANRARVIFYFDFFLWNAETKVNMSVAKKRLCNLSKILIVWFLKCMKEKCAKNVRERKQESVFRKEQFRLSCRKDLLFIVYFRPHLPKNAHFLVHKVITNRDIYIGNITDKENHL